MKKFHFTDKDFSFSIYKSTPSGSSGLQSSLASLLGVRREHHNSDEDDFDFLPDFVKKTILPMTIVMLLAAIGLFAYYIMKTLLETCHKSNYHLAITEDGECPQCGNRIIYSDPESDKDSPSTTSKSAKGSKGPQKYDFFGSSVIIEEIPSSKPSSSSPISPDIAPRENNSSQETSYLPSRIELADEPFDVTEDEKRFQEHLQNLPKPPKKFPRDVRRSRSPRSSHKFHNSRKGPDRSPIYGPFKPRQSPSTPRKSPQPPQGPGRESFFEEDFRLMKDYVKKYIEKGSQDLQKGISEVQDDINASLEETLGVMSSVTSQFEEDLSNLDDFGEDLGWIIDPIDTLSTAASALTKPLPSAEPYTIIQNLTPLLLPPLRKALMGNNQSTKNNTNTGKGTKTSSESTNASSKSSSNATRVTNPSTKPSSHPRPRSMPPKHKLNPKPFSAQPLYPPTKLPSHEEQHKHVSTPLKKTTYIEGTSLKPSNRPGRSITVPSGRQYKTSGSHSEVDRLSNAVKDLKISKKPLQGKDKGKGKGNNLIISSNTSKGEEICRDVLMKIFHKPFISTRPNFLCNPETGHNLELDCYNSELRLACEYNGAQHYQFNPRFHKNKEDFANQVKRDRFKALACAREGITLIVVPYTVSNEHIEGYIMKELVAKGIIKGEKKEKKGKRGK